METRRWMWRLEKWRGVERVEENLAPYEEALQEINRRGEDFARKTADQLREAADRALGMRPFDVQVMAGVALSRGKLVEMQTGEGKTLAAVAPACLNAG